MSMLSPLTPSDQLIIDQIVAQVQAEFANESSGHDWFHIERVWKMAKHLAHLESELNLEPDQKLDGFVIEAGALLHDIADWKFHDGDESVGPAKASAILESFGVSPERIAQVADIVKHISFKGAHVATEMKTLEGELVQDADRLEAIGAIGIARAFAYGGAHGRSMHDPAVPPLLAKSFSEYKNSKSTSFNHFYEKLVFIKDKMNTAAGKQIAADRHEYLETFMKRFLAEWQGEC